MGELRLGGQWLDTRLADTFKTCSFCGAIPNIFQVWDKRCEAWAWVVECATMGCVVGRSHPEPSLKTLRAEWNRRK